MKTGKLIVLTGPLTEMIDHAGYFIQMGMASLPILAGRRPQLEVSGMEECQAF
jgi:hypothetical protein